MKKITLPQSSVAPDDEAVLKAETIDKKDLGNSKFSYFGKDEEGYSVFQLLESSLNLPIEEA